MCVESRTTVNMKDDNLLGRAILTFAFTTGTRVGSILPPKYNNRKRKHVAILHNEIR